MKVANYFCDGYTQPGFIAAAPRLHGELRFTFRPALVEERSQLVDAAGRLKSDAYDRRAADFLAQKLVDWELADDGRDVAVSPAALLRLHPELFVKLHRIVLGWTASDVDPRWTEEEKQLAADEQYESALSGKSVGEVRDLKNLILGVNLLVFHPRIVARPCCDCQRWLFDDEHRKVLRLGKPVPRPQASAPPCWSCPKKSPQESQGFERGVERISRTIDFYFRIRGTAGRYLSAAERRDSVLARNMAIVDAVVRKAEVERSARMIAALLKSNGEA